MNNSNAGRQISLELLVNLVLAKFVSKINIMIPDSTIVTLCIGLENSLAISNGIGSLKIANLRCWALLAASTMCRPWSLRDCIACENCVGSRSGKFCEAFQFQVK